MDSLYGYKSMPEWHKNNLKSYIIYDGIYSCFPNILDDEAKFIHDIICEKIENENVNPYSIAYYLTDNYTRGNISKKELKEATSGQISEAVFFDKLYYLIPSKDEIEVEEIYEK